ncbi:MAG: helix-turn-helix transcriptional regulator [Hungatella sp.]|nr:helix-turn-helix transcriptional regulator [Hungatella sp.]
MVFSSYEAVVYIQQNYHRELSVDEVANFCRLNRNYFSRRFKELTGSCLGFCYVAFRYN